MCKNECVLPQLGGNAVGSGQPYGKPGNHNPGHPGKSRKSGNPRKFWEPFAPGCTRNRKGDSDFQIFIITAISVSVHHKLVLF